MSKNNFKDLEAITAWLEKMPQCLAQEGDGDPHRGKEMADQIRRGTFGARAGNVRIVLSITAEHVQSWDCVTAYDISTLRAEAKSSE